MQITKVQPIILNQNSNQGDKKSQINLASVNSTKLASFHPVMLSNISFGSVSDYINAILNSENYKLYYLLKDNNADGVNDFYEPEWASAATPLMYASYVDYDKLVEKFLNFDAVDVNLQNPDGKTAAMIAAEERNIDSLLLFMNCDRVDFTLKDKNGLTAFDYYENSVLKSRRKLKLEDVLRLKELCSAQNRPKTTEYFPTPMHELAMSSDLKEEINDTIGDNYEIYHEYFNAGATYKCTIYPTTYKYHGATPLMVAISQNKPGFYHWALSEPEIDVNLQDYDGNTALHHAVMFKSGSVPGTLDAIESLLNHPDIDVTIRNNDGKTAWELWHDHPRITNENIDKKFQDLIKMQKETKRESRQSSPSDDMNYVLNNFTENLTPENNILSEREITDKFIDFVRRKKDLQLAKRILEATPLIILDKKTMEWVMETKDTEFADLVYDYKFNKQPKMREEYDKKRAEILNKMLSMSYDEMLKSPIVLSSADGFRQIMCRPEFNPNQKIGKNTLFEVACKIDESGELAKRILSSYDDVDYSKVKNTGAVGKHITEYQMGGQVAVKLNNIRFGLVRQETAQQALDKLKSIVVADDFNPEFVDMAKNNVLHTVANAADDRAKEIIFAAVQKGVDINSKNLAGQTPLMIALKTLKRVYDDEDQRRNVFAIISFMLNKGADVNVQDMLGQSPLHYVCATNSPTALKLVLNQKPNIALTDNKNRRAKYYLEGKSEMMEIYKQYLDA